MLRILLFPIIFPFRAIVAPKYSSERLPKSCIIDPLPQRVSRAFDVCTLLHRLKSKRCLGTGREKTLCTVQLVLRFDIRCGKWQAPPRRSPDQYRCWCFKVMGTRAFCISSPPVRNNPEIRSLYIIVCYDKTSKQNRTAHFCGAAHWRNERRVLTRRRPFDDAHRWTVATGQRPHPNNDPPLPRRSDAFFVPEFPHVVIPPGTAPPSASLLVPRLPHSLLCRSSLALQSTLFEKRWSHLLTNCFSQRPLGAQ